MVDDMETRCLLHLVQIVYYGIWMVVPNNKWLLSIAASKKFSHLPCKHGCDESAVSFCCRRTCRSQVMSSSIQKTSPYLVLLCIL